MRQDHWLLSLNLPPEVPPAVPCFVLVTVFKVHLITRSRILLFEIVKGDMGDSNQKSEVRD